MTNSPERRIVALAGSLRTGSFSRAIAASLDELAPDEVAVAVFDDLAGIPLYDQDVQDRGVPELVERLGSMIAEADAVVIVSPEYNHSISGVLKNALDWLSRLPDLPLAGKPTAIQTSSPGLLGGARAYEQVRQVLAAMDARVINKPEVIVTEVGLKIEGSTGRISDAGTRRQIGKQLAALAASARRGSTTARVEAVVPAAPSLVSQKG